jgi:hypothetical protein
VVGLRTPLPNIRMVSLFISTGAPRQVGLVGYYHQQLTVDTGEGAIFGDKKTLVAAICPQIGFIEPLGFPRGFLEFKAYSEFDAERRTSGWNGWITLAVPLSPPPSEPEKSMYMK